MRIWLIALIMVIAVCIFLIIENNLVDFRNKESETPMKIESDIFRDSEMIPTDYTCYGESIQIPIKILDVPKGTVSLAVIVDDPDAPGGEFVHWLAWNIKPETLVIESIRNISGAVEGNTSLNKPGWVAPCPPSGIHHYNFHLYALNTLLSIDKSSTKTDLLKAIEGHIMESATLVGLYGK
jgi:Raf kinase inhibitor-like YbhB/YbcL family protein